MKNKRYTDFAYKIAFYQRSRIYVIFKKIKANKCDHTMTLLGCTGDIIIKWFQYMFNIIDPTMTFQNHGIYWHIDHVIPCTLFDFSEDEEQRRCFHWTNLKPMNGKENISKGNRLTEQEIYEHEYHLINFCLKNKINILQIKYFDRLKYVNVKLELPSLNRKIKMALANN